MTAVTTTSAVPPGADVIGIGVGVAKDSRNPGALVLVPGAEAVIGAVEILDGLGMPGAEGETVRLHSPAGLILAVGLGEVPGDWVYDAETLRRAAGVAARNLSGTKLAALALPAESDEGIEAVALGALLGAYTFTAYRTNDSGKPPGGELAIITGRGISPVTGWLALAENMPSGTAIRPGDVLRMYGGSTVEVLNTDAEGRLVLADTLVRAGQDQPDAIVDVATLTGAMVLALGRRTFGVMANDDALREHVLEAARQAGEQAWPMPLPAELREGLNSRVADLANTGDRMGGGLAAGLFLEKFVPDGTPWAHLDIAGPAFHEGDPYGYTPNGRYRSRRPHPGPAGRGPVVRIVYQVDAFTTVPFAGNPAGVVLDADGLTETEMLAVARELNNSETAFVLSPDGFDHDLVVRFFTPTAEVPSCGHATVGTHFARAVEYGLGSVSLVQKTGTGLLQRVDVRREDDRVRIGMHQGQAEFGPELDGGRLDRLLRALGVAAAELADNAPVQVVSTGHSKVLVELRSRAVVDGLAPDLAALAALSRECGSNGYFVFTRTTGDDRLLTWARMFAPAIGIAEDPVTGNGHGPLGGYLVRYGLLAPVDGLAVFTGRQGAAMGRPGDVEVRVAVDPGGALDISIWGDAVTAFRAGLAIPAAR